MELGQAVNHFTVIHGPLFLFVCVRGREEVTYSRERERESERESQRESERERETEIGRAHV